MAATTPKPPAPPGPPWVPPAPPRSPAPDWGPEEPPHQRWWLARRVVAAALICVLAGAGAGAYVAGREIHNDVALVTHNKALAIAPGTLASPTGGGETILLVGDDTRRQSRFYSRGVPNLSNEMLLVRLDPSKPWISMLSIPRDLQTTVAGYNYTGRFNGTLSLGGNNIAKGITLLAQQIKQVLHLSINHVVLVTFPRFEHAVDALGCVYSTIDTRYYHNNANGGVQYQNINLQPGYQRLCGPEALSYVSFRHGDNALIRDARDQSFLLDLKKQFGPQLSDLGSLHRFLKIFGESVQMDPGLRSTGELESVAELAAGASSKPVRRVEFHANVGATAVTATPLQIEENVQRFLGNAPPPPTKHTAAVANAVHRSHRSSFYVHLNLTHTPRQYLQQATADAPYVPFPIEYPRVREQSAFAAPDQFRWYTLRGLDGQTHRAYVTVIAQGGLGQYYDVQGMGWTTAPLFDNPDQTVHVGGRTYYLYYEGSSLKMVAWYQYRAVYWVRNTLSDSVGNSEMLAIAEEAIPLDGEVAGTPTQSQAGVGAYGLPTRVIRASSTSSLTEGGALAGLLAWIALVALAVRYALGRRELATLRVQLRPAISLEVKRRVVLAHYGISPGGHARSFEPGGRSAPRSRARLPVLAGGAAALVLAIALAGYALTSSGTSGRAATSAPVRHRPVSPGAGLLVSVLNATATHGAAHGLAQQLVSKGVKVIRIANAPAPPTGVSGVQVLYAAGAQNAATRVASLLGAATPLVAPLDPVTAASAGPGAQVVVVLS